MIMRGSLHKYFNNGFHNWNDFTFPQFNKVLQLINDECRIEINQGTIHNIEFGVNVELPMPVAEFLNSIVSYKGLNVGREFFKGTGNMVRFELDQYELKIYDKGLQYCNKKEFKELGLDKRNILRFEIKVTRMQYLKRRGINIASFNDLTNQHNVEMLRDLVLNTFDELLVYDESVLNLPLKRSERDLLTQGKNPNFWVDCKIKSPENFKKKRKRFRNLINHKVEITIQQRVKGLIESKLNALIRG